MFICRENIGRSQMAEAFYNNKHGGEFAISAGIEDSSKKYNGHPRPDVVQVMEEVGINIGNKLVKQYTDKMLEMVKSIVVLCDKEICPQVITSKGNVKYIKIKDPPDSKKIIDVLRAMRDEIRSIINSLQ